MFLPIGDAPNPKGAAPVTYVLIAANVAIYVFVTFPLGSVRPDPRDPRVAEYVHVMTEALDGRVSPRELARRVSAYDVFVFNYGFRPGAPSATDLFFCMFLHGGFLHVFGNMLFLWIYGDNVERRLGAIRYLFWYLGTGVAATLFHAAFTPGSQIPLVGASGAISGVLGFYFVWFPRNTVRMLWFLPPFVMQVFEVPARLVLGLYLVADNLLPFLIARGDQGVAFGAHIGGFVAGAAVAWLSGRRVFSRPRDLDMPVRADRGAAAVREALATGRFQDAAEGYFALPPAQARGLLAPRDAFALAGWLRETGHPQAALGVLRRVLRDAPRDAGLAELHGLAGLILFEDLGEPTAAYQYLLSALDLGLPSESAAPVRRALASIEALQKRRVGRLHTPHDW